MLKNSKQVQRYMFGRGAFDRVGELVDERRRPGADRAVFFVDHWFQGRPLADRLPLREGDRLIFVDTTDEPKTSGIDAFHQQLRGDSEEVPAAVVGVGGGSTLDVAKAVANLLTNGGKAEDYQGWDLVREPAAYKIGVPTLSGTGAESSRTCVMTNTRTGVKLGMNSDHTIYDQLVLDPELTASVPRNQYFYSGMDTYIHCIESLAGRYRNAIGDAFSDQSLRLCQEAFLSEDMMSEVNREKVMIASYLGGCAIANSFVGVVHPFSAGLSVVLGLHHGLANCIAITALGEFYPRQLEEFWRMVEAQKVEIPRGVCRTLSETQYEQLYRSTVVHEKPLSNALGDDFRSILTRDKVIGLFMEM